MTDSIHPEFELVLDFMAVLVTSKFDEDPINNERVSLETPFSHYKSMGNFRRSGAANSIVSGPIWLRVKLQDFMHVLVTCKYKKNRIKKKLRKGGDIVFPILSQWALSVAIETRVLSQIVPKPYATFPPP